MLTLLTLVDAIVQYRLQQEQLRLRETVVNEQYANNLYLYDISFYLYRNGGSHAAQASSVPKFESVNVTSTPNSQ